MVKNNRLGALIALMVGAGVAGFVHAASPQRSWSARESVTLRYITSDQSTPSWWMGSRDPEESHAVLFSPDRKYFFYLTHHGEVESDSNVYELRVYEVSSVEAWLVRGVRKGVPSPLRSVKRRSFSSEDAGIVGARWSEDGSEVQFLAVAEDDVSAEGEGGLQAYRLSVQSGTTEKLTREKHKLTNFAYRNGGLIFSASVPPEMSEFVPSYPMEAVRRNADGTVVGVRWPSQTPRNRTFVSYGKGEAHEIEGNLVDQWSIAPDGRHAVIRQYKREPYLFRIIIVDLASGDVKPTGVAWLPIPYVKEPGFSALWSEDGRRLVLVNVALSAPKDASSNEVRPAVIAAYDLQDGQWRTLEPLKVEGEGSDSRIVTAVGWNPGQQGREFLVTHRRGDQAASGTLYRLNGGQWASREVDASMQPNQKEVGARREMLSVKVRQSANDPPMVIASNGTREVALLPPDPTLDGVWRARVERFEFRDSSGKTHSAGIMLPRGYRKGTPVPFVIQTYTFEPKLFLPDGHGSSGFAAQSLVARGMGVIQIETMVIEQEGHDPREGPPFVSLIDSAIDTLVEAGMADPQKIGIIGFSHSGFHVYYAITHPGRRPLAAAVCADSFTASYRTYITAAAGSWLPTREHEAYMGGDFWQHKPEWMELETTFNVDRVRTPALFTVHGKRIGEDVGYPEAALETIGAFLRNRKPLEYLFFPDGAHNLQRPRERIAMIESVVDWMSFWLQSYEDPDSRKSEQYARWRPMKALATAEGVSR